MSLMEPLSFEQKVEICKTNNGSYDGNFFLAVKSTSIFCLPSCKAKFPKVENIEFYKSKDEAMVNGYRGCKRCRSDHYPNTQPEWMKLVKREIQSLVYSKLDNDILEDIAGVNITTIKKYFVKHMGVSPSKYHRTLKLILAKEKIMSGEDYRDVCFELGFESISGFRHAYKKEFKETPGETHGK